MMATRLIRFDLMPGKVLPCGGIPLVVWWTWCVDALVTSSHVEAHPVCSTLDVLFQALIYIFKYTKQLIIIAVPVLMR